MDFLKYVVYGAGIVAAGAIAKSLMDGDPAPAKKPSGPTPVTPTGPTGTPSTVPTGSTGTTPVTPVTPATPDTAPSPAPTPSAPVYHSFNPNVALEDSATMSPIFNAPSGSIFDDLPDYIKKPLKSILLHYPTPKDMSYGSEAMKQMQNMSLQAKSIGFPNVSEWIDNYIAAVPRPSHL